MKTATLNYLCYFGILLSYFIVNFANGQTSYEIENYNYEKILKKQLNEKLKKYHNNDTSIMNIKNAIALFEKSGPPKNPVKMISGIAYVLVESDCEGTHCDTPKIYPAGLYEEDNGSGILKSVRNKNTKEPVGKDYIQLYISNDLKYGESSTFLSLIKLRNAELDVKWKLNSSEQVLIGPNAITFIRESEEWVIGISTGTDLLYDDIFVYLFRTSLEDVPGEQILLSTIDNKENQNTQKSIGLYENNTGNNSSEKKEIPESLKHCPFIKNSLFIERERNFFGNMIEAIVNAPQMKDYYHGNDFFIIATSSFRNDLEIKYKGKDIWIIPTRCSEIKHYLEILTSDYAYNKKSVTFTFSYPSEGVTGKANFTRAGEEYVLKKIEVFE